MSIFSGKEWSEMVRELLPKLQATVNVRGYLLPFTHPQTQSCSQQMFTGHLLCSSHHSKYWRYSRGHDSQKSLPLPSSRRHKINKVSICNILCIFSNLGCCHKRLINKGRAMEIKTTCNTHGGWTDNIYIQWLNTFCFTLRSFLFISIMGFLGGAVIKNSPVNTGDTVSIPGSWRFAGVGNGNPL